MAGENPVRLRVDDPDALLGRVGADPKGAAIDAPAEVGLDEAAARPTHHQRHPFVGPRTTVRERLGLEHDYVASAKMRGIAKLRPARGR